MKVVESTVDGNRSARLAARRAADSSAARAARAVHADRRANTDRRGVAAADSVRRRRTTRAASGSSTGITGFRRATRSCASTRITPPNVSASSSKRTRPGCKEISAEDLFPEFDVSDFAGLPADEAYEAETDLAGSPSRLRLVSEWRRQIQPNASSRAIEIVRASAPFRELRGQGRVRPAGTRRSRARGVVTALRERSRPVGAGRLVPADVQRDGRRGPSLSRRPRRTSGGARARLSVPRRIAAAARRHLATLPPLALQSFSVVWIQPLPLHEF